MAAAKAGRGPISPSSLLQETMRRVLSLPEPPACEAALCGVSFQLMGWILKDRARSETARKAREVVVGADRATAEASPALVGESSESRQVLFDALRELEAQDPRKADALILADLAQLKIAEIAELQGVTARTVQRDLSFARRWMASHLAQHRLSQP